MWGLHEFGRVDAAERAAELLLHHRLFNSGDRVINKQFTDLRYPPYWHYDILQALLILSRMGLAADARAADALDQIERKRRPTGVGSQRLLVAGHRRRLDRTGRLVARRTQRDDHPERPQSPQGERPVLIHRPRKEIR